MEYYAGILKIKSVFMYYANMEKGPQWFVKWEKQIAGPTEWHVG